MAEVSANLVDVYVFRRRGGGAVELLLLRRRPGARLGGTWQAVHGKVEAGESAWQTALRELREETGLAPTAFWQLESVNTFYMAAPDRVMLCPCFAAEVDRRATVTLSDEHTEHRWEPAERAMAEFMWPGQRQAVRELLEHIVTPSGAEPHLRIPLA